MALGADMPSPETARRSKFLTEIKKERMDTTRKAQVTASEDSLLEAMKTNNVERLDALLHDDLLFNGPTGETATKAIDLQNYRSGNIHLHTVTSSDRVVH